MSVDDEVDVIVEAVPPRPAPYDDLRGFAPAVEAAPEVAPKGSAKYTCRGCGYGAEERWLGRCPSCSRYYNIVGRKRGEKSPVTAATAANAKPVHYIQTGIAEFDRVIGGGLVPGGGDILFGGERGQGKTTLLLQVLDGFTKATGEVAYFVSNEQKTEALLQTLARIGCASDKLVVQGELGDVDKILDEVERLGAKAIVIDSIKTAFDDDSKANMGTPEQIGLVSDALTNYSRKHNVVIIMIAHQTGLGEIAGGQTVQHLVDTVMRIANVDMTDPDTDEVIELRELSIDAKNRNGSQIATEMMEMTPTGLKPLSPRARRLFIRMRNSGRDDDGPRRAPRSPIVER